MSASVNKVIIVGHLGRDPETRYLANGDAVTNLAVATSESWKDKNSGEKKEQTEWHRVVLFRKVAEIAQQYLKKGSQVYLEGRLQTRKYDKEGVTHYSTEIVCDEMKMLGGRDSGEAQEQEHRTRPQPAAQRPTQRQPVGDFDDDVPF